MILWAKRDQWAKIRPVRNLLPLCLTSWPTTCSTNVLNAEERNYVTCRFNILKRVRHWMASRIGWWVRSPYFRAFSIFNCLRICPTPLHGTSTDVVRFVSRSRGSRAIGPMCAHYAVATEAGPLSLASIVPRCLGEHLLLQRCPRLENDSPELPQRADPITKLPWQN
jgi:hypothetical protein